MTTRILLLSLAATLSARAELKLPAVIGDNMVLQQKQTNPIWGWDAPGTVVTVKFGAQTVTGKADEKGKWSVKLDPVPASAKPATMSIAGTTQREIKNILVGEVWVCSGQSNMGFSVDRALNAEIEIAMAKYPDIRLISVPQVGTQEIQEDFQGQWEPCSPQNVGSFTAVGFFFGRTLHETLGVPVGLIDNAWGGSSAEAWVRRDVLEKDKRFADLLGGWKKQEAEFSPEKFEKQKADYGAKVAAWNEARRAAVKNKQPPPAPLPRPPQNPMTGQHRPGNLYAGVLHPTIGYGIKGVVWYQGESNAGRAYEYAYLFPLMIQHWRDEWKQGDFPFYWVQLADFKPEQPLPGDSDWAELREAQSKTMSLLKNTGQAVIIDLGEGQDIHPRNKRDVAARLVRWALAKDYGLKIPYRSPELKSMEVQGRKAVVTVDCFGSSLRTVDTAEVKGFAVCGADKKWVWADARLLSGDKLEVSSSVVAAPVAVRYAWADNPVCNVYSKEGLPLTPFRTDDFPLVSKQNAEKAAELTKLTDAKKKAATQKAAEKK
ncbi:MAG: sialate O-acetylesterase [Verrucomicrobiaceae bacterium]|nr:sialate O-acetylesterase [Verrucomicrobiaceae bacterium]